MSNTNQALSFINAVTGVKHINVTINNAIKTAFTRTAKTATSSGKGGLSYINEVLAHKDIAKGTSQNAKAVKALMLHMRELGIEAGLALFNGVTYTDDVIQAKQQAVNTFFMDTLASIKADADAKRALAKVKREAEQLTPVQTDDANSGADADETPFELITQADDVLLIADDTLVDVGGVDVAFGDLVKAYHAQQNAMILELMSAPTQKAKQVLHA